jgi:hypothetical protein
MSVAAAAPAHADYVEADQIGERAWTRPNDHAARTPLIPTTIAPSPIRTIDAPPPGRHDEISTVVAAQHHIVGETIAPTLQSWPRELTINQQRSPLQ